MSDLGTEDRPLRVAIVGSGPSGFYAADALLKRKFAVEVDMFDRLPTPYGLVRLGVAPDHQKIKTAVRVYEKVAGRPGFEFLGNVMVGKDISVPELKRHYDAIIFAYGAETDRKLGIPGEDLPGSHTATEFVAWYNGHPDYVDREFDLSQEVAVIIGQGNVAVDVCRILAKTVDELKETDIAQYALDALAESAIKEIYMVGRRGPVQAKFTPQEVKELGRLEDCDPVVNPEDLELDDVNRAELEHGESANAQKIFPILEEFAQRPAGHAKRRLHFVFLRSPKEIVGRDRVERIVLERNVLEGEPLELRAKGTGEVEELSCGLVFRSVGYHGQPMPEAPFDERSGVIPNEGGRVVKDGVIEPGLYTVGWIKRGPSGVIGTNKPDAVETVEALQNDIDKLPPCPLPTREPVLELLAQRGIRVVTFDDWKKIDAAETEAGAAIGKPREKITRVADMIRVIEP